MRDSAHWRCDWRVLKFADLAALAARRPYEVLEIPGNVLTTDGVNFLFQKALGQSLGGLTLDVGGARLGVGDGTAAASATDTDLAGTNKWYQVLDATPVLAANTLKFSATVAPGDAAFAWNEFAIDLGAGGSSGAVVGARLLNHRSGAAGGTKPSTQAWIAQTTLAIA